jgi:hypothetical protein
VLVSTESQWWELTDVNETKIAQKCAICQYYAPGDGGIEFFREITGPNIRTGGGLGRGNKKARKVLP